ncbi:hypothetical protein BH11VER1_BH11VER1_10750 [soil metagenome]
MGKIVYFLTHPIQNQTPLLRALSEKGFNLHVVYASTAGVQGYHDPGFGVNVAWDVPLLDGYSHESLEMDHVCGPFWYKLGRYRRRIRQWLSDNPVDVTWIHGWGQPYNLASFLEASHAGVQIIMQAETHLRCLRGSVLRKFLHRFFLQKLFKKVHHFLAIGTANREFYLSYGVDSEKISFMPYTVDNQFFRQKSETAISRMSDLKADLQLNADRPVVLFAGKLIKAKAVDILIQALSLTSIGLPEKQHPQLVIVGDGELKTSLEALANKLLPGDVRFAGFRNQSEMPALYSLCDVFVLPSDFEPWGLVVNEAMNAGKPIVVSDRVGSHFDLVQSGVNGAVFPSNNPEALATALHPLIVHEETRRSAGRASLNRIAQWGIPQAVSGFEEAMHQLNRASSSEGNPIQTPFLRATLLHSNIQRTPSRPRVSVSYVAVHNAYQQAQAAFDGSMLSRFYCSAYDAPGFWGHRFSKIVGKAKLASLGGIQIPSSAVRENPWPMLHKRISERIQPGSTADRIFEMSERFDRWTANQLNTDPCELFVGYETCAQYSFEVAHTLGKRCLLDCPQFHPAFLWQLLAEAADLCSLPPPPPIDTPKMADRKVVEFATADTLLVYSKVHALSFQKAGFNTSRILISPLWFNPSIWYPSDEKQKRNDGILRLLFVGGADLRKGIPFLLKAIRPLAPHVRLALAGGISEEMKPFIQSNEDICDILGPKTKPALRDLYTSHDLLVLPSVADAFGFVALEAMSCGMPVVVTDTCGAPVPEPAWRVRALNVEDLQARFEHYLAHPDLLEADGALAIQFAGQFTAETFRARMQQYFIDASTAETRHQN